MDMHAAAAMSQVQRGDEAAAVAAMAGRQGGGVRRQVIISGSGCG